MRLTELPIKSREMRPYPPAPQPELFIKRNPPHDWTARVNFEPVTVWSGKLQYDAPCRGIVSTTRSARALKPVGTPVQIY